MKEYPDISGEYFIHGYKMKVKKANWEGLAARARPFYYAKVDELKGLDAYGETLEELMSNMEDAYIEWVSIEVELEREIPNPEIDEYSQVQKINEQYFVLGYEIKFMEFPKNKEMICGYVEELGVGVFTKGMSIGENAGKVRQKVVDYIKTDYIPNRKEIPNPNKFD